MPKGMLFEYAVLHHPKPKKDANGNEEPAQSKLVTRVQTVLRSSQEEVSILAAKSIPDEYLDRLDQIQIIVRPF